MQVALLGVRGSTPAPGPEFVRYGGHTSCVALTAAGESEPRLVLDAGTGLRRLTRQLCGRPFTGTVLLSHLHWDHVQGLPFFAAGDRADATVELVVPAQDGALGRDLLARSMSPPSFPIEPEGLQGDWTFTALEPGTFAVGPFVVTAAEVTHKGGRTFGYRVEADGTSLAYLPDHAPALGETPGLLPLVGGVDVLLHDAQNLDAERTFADLYGHSTISDAVSLAARAGVRTLVLFHHGPARTDDALDAVAASVCAGDAALQVVVAREGMVLEPGVRPAPA